MKKRRDTDQLFTLSGTRGNRKNSLFSPETSRLTPDRSPNLSAYDSSQNFFKRVESENSLTSIIEEKVTNLRTKFSELNGLRKKFIGPTHKTKNELSNTTKARVSSSELNKTTKKPEIFTGKIFQSDDKRNMRNTQKEEPLEYDLNKFYHNPNFGNIFHETEYKKANQQSPTTDIKILRSENYNIKQQLQITKNELKKSEAIRTKQEGEMKECQDKCNKLTENNKMLRLQLSRLEKQFKTVDGKKANNTDAIKNLSYIILSKDNQSRDSVSKHEDTNNCSISLKYLESLNDLHSSDQFTLNLLSNLHKNKIKESCKMIMDIQGMLHERIDKTRKNIIALGGVVFDCKSPQPQIKIPQSEERLDRKRGCIEENDYISFMKSEAAMVEELLLMT